MICALIYVLSNSFPDGGWPADDDELGFALAVLDEPNSTIQFMFLPAISK